MSKIGFLKYTPKSAPLKLVRRKRMPRKKVTATKTLTKLIQKVIHKDVETKQAYNVLDLSNYNSGINSAGDAVRILPNILNGTGDANRIGDQLRAMKLAVKGHMILSTVNNSTSANCRIAVRMMIVQPRNYSQIDNVQTNATTWMSTLLKKGASTVNFAGNISDLYAPINTDAIIKYYDKVTYITIPFIVNNVGATSVNTTVSQDVVNSVKFFNIALKVKNKLLKYDTTGSSTLQPMNYAPTFLIGYCHLDGSAPDVLQTQLAVAFDTILDYEDA